MRYGLFLLVGVLPLLTGCRIGNSDPDKGAREYLGVYALEVLSMPTRIDGWNYIAPDGAGYTSPPVKSLDLSFASQWRDLLFDEATFATLGRAEAFKKAVGFRIYRQEKWIEITISYNNDQLMLRTREPGGHPVSQPASFYKVRGDVYSLIRRALPGAKVPG